MIGLLTSPVVVEGFGWIAALLTMATFVVNSMVSLRLLALGSCVCFAFYAAVLQLWPLLAAQLFLIPINAYRIWKIFAMRKVVTHMTDETEVDFSVAMTYGRKKSIPAGSVIFEKGDRVDCLYYLAEGLVEIDETDVTVDAGKIFGEMAFFTGTETRTATMRSVRDSVVYELDKRRFSRLQYEDPAFGMAVMSTITKRLMANAAQAAES